jgi:putative nucleotidyltransferase with HDIG domain
VNIECEVCKSVFKIKDGIIPPGSKVKYTCKKCRPLNIAANAEKQSLENIPLFARANDRPVNGANADQSDNKAAFLRDKILPGIKNLPPMPQVVMEIHNQLSAENINIKKIADSIETDQALASEVLRLANSACYGMSGWISSIQSALTMMGLKGLLEAVAMAGCQRLLTGKLPGYGYEAEDFWRHSLAVAFGCKILALLKNPGISEAAYLAGLIHDVGKLVLDRFVAEKKTEIESFMQSEQRTLLDAEIDFFGCSHAKVAGEICKRWKFPPVLWNAITWHHNPSGSNKDLLSYILHMADQLATSIGIGYDSDDILYQLEEGTMGFLDLKRSDLGDLVSKITESMEKITRSASGKKIQFV